MYDTETIEEQLEAGHSAITIVSYISPEIAKILVDTGVELEWMLEDFLRQRYADHPAIVQLENPQ